VFGKMFDERVRKAGLDLTRQQYRVILILEEFPGINQVELADRLDIEKAGVTGILDRMEKKNAGWIERRRDKTDRRLTRLYLSPEASLDVKLLKSVIVQWEEEANSWLSPNIVQDMGEELKALHDKLLSTNTIEDNQT
jgi:MarR family transcriptional regulator, transcriptional regulator for hemolysin